LLLIKATGGKMQQKGLFILILILIIAIGIQAVETKYVQVEDIKIAYQEYGSSDALLLIMGYGSTMDIWPEELITKMSAEYKVIIFDNRGMGNTTAGTKGFSIKQFAEDSAGLLAALKIEKANVMGWSMGSYIAQELAINFPAKVEKLVLYGSTFGGKQEVDPTTQTLAILNDYSGTPQQIGERFFKLLFPVKFLQDNPEFYKTFPQPKEHSTPEDMGKQSMAIQKWSGTFGRINNTKIKTMFLCGTEDVIVPPQNSVDLAHDIPNSWLIQVDGAGHGLMYQYTERMINILKLFLKQHTTCFGIKLIQDF
jgi:pimeloyl-ACP methyl ester carboxylesterase